MKKKGLIITIILFFLLVNTSYYWESKLGSFAIPASLLLVGVYFGFLILLLRQIYLAAKEKFKDKQRILIMTLLATVLVVTFFKPDGLISFSRFEGKDILVAWREGVANCITTFKLKEGRRFIEKRICFGIIEVKGDYTVKNDTIFFENVDPGRGENEFYRFAIIRPSKFNKDKKEFDLVRFKDFNDTIGNELWITKNDLFKYTGKN